MLSGHFNLKSTIFIQRIISVITIVCFSLLSSAQITLTGKVINEKLQPVEGASVYFLNTQFETVTNNEGMFFFTGVEQRHYILSISSIGYAAMSNPINVDSSIGEIKITLRPSFNQLDEVVISTQKKEELMQRAPLSITTLSSQQVADYRLWDIHELTSISPNLYVANPGDKRNVTSIRGIISTSYDPAVATYIDGVNQFGLDTYISQLYDIERIEIARGPQGTLYGRNAMGGVINIITKAPQNKSGGFAEISFGNYSRKRITAGLTAPLVKNRLFLGVAGLWEGTDGFYENKFTNSSYDQQHAASGNYFLKYLSKTNWNFAWNVKHMANRNKGAFPLVMGVNEAIKNPFTVNQNAVTKMMDNTFNTSLSIGHTGHSLNFSSQTAYQSNYRYYTDAIDADFSPLDGISIYNNYGNNWNKVTVLTQEFRLSSYTGDSSKLDWTAGTYFFYQHSPVRQATRFGEDALMMEALEKNFSLMSTTDAKNKGIAFYGQAEYKLSRNIQFIAGLRYDYEHKHQSILGEYQKDPDPVPVFAFRPDTAATARFHSFSPKISLAFYPSPTNTFFITYSKGFRAGGLTPLSSDPGQPPLYAFKPETSNNIDIGTKSSFLGNRLMVRLSVFYLNVSNVQVPTLVLPDAVTITQNTGKLISKGIEMEASSTFRGFEFNYSFGYTHATYDALKISQNNSEINLRGKRQIFTPEFTSVLAAQYNIGLNNKGTTRLHVRGEWNYLGRQYFDLANTIEQAPYHLLNAKCGLTIKQVSIVLWARNLNDARYISYAYDFGAVHLGKPRTYGATVRFGF